MSAAAAPHLKALDAENARLKRLLPEWRLDDAALNEIVGKKW